MSCPLYLFTGPEFGERNDAIDAVKKSLKKQFGSVDEYLFYLVETPLSEAMMSVQGGSLFSDANCVVVKGAELLKKKEDIEYLSKWIESEPPESNTLILVSDEISCDSKLEKTVPPSNRKKFYEMFDNKKLPWILNYFSKNGYLIEKDAAQTILDMVENNTQAMKAECSRFFVLFKPDHEITVDDVEKVLVNNREENAFTLFNKMATSTESPQKTLEEALVILQKIRLSKENSSVVIFAGLSSCFRKLQAWHRMMQLNPYADDFEKKKNGFTGSLMQAQYQKAAQKWTAGQTLAVLANIAAADMEIRSTGTAVEDLVMQRTIYEIVIKKGGSSGTYENE